MAITDNGTACEVNTLLRWLLPSLVDYGPRPSHDDAMKAAESLAGKAHKQLMAGVSSSGVRQATAVDGVRLAAFDSLGNR